MTGVTEIIPNFAVMKLHLNKQLPLEKVVANSIKNFASPTIIAALSGGADSVALIAALLSIRNTTVIAAHCNFHLRGEESMRDQFFAERLCSQLGIKLLIRHFDVSGYQRLHPGTSLEMACRELRYDWFRTLLTDYDADRLATGHNADDNIETLLLNLLRGSGTAGLRGMSPDNGTVIRPLLSIHRNEIESYLKAKNLNYIVDSSNLTSDFRRNFLRNEILPLLRQRWPGLNKSLDRSISLIRAENDVVEKCVERLLPPEGEPLNAGAVLSFEAPELLVRRYILPLQPLTTTAGEIVAAMRADKSDIRRWSLPKGTAILRARKLYISPSSSQEDS